MNADDMLSLLGDEYTQRVLRAVVERPRTGREIQDVAGVSKPTVYRRLDSLEEAGLVSADLELDPNGHHRKQYRAVADRIHVELDGTNFDLHVR